MRPYIMAALFTMAKMQTKCPLREERIKKMWCVYTVYDLSQEKE